MNGHTPGPWRASENGKWVVADSDIGTWSDEDNNAFYGGALVCESIVSTDNALLIAAAPDLLAACEKAAEALNKEQLGWTLTPEEAERFDAMLHLVAAIAKAKGVSA